MKPVSRVLVVSDDVTWQAEVMAGLGAAAVRLENPFGLTFVAANTTAETMDLLARDGEVQVVLVDRQLKGTANGEAAAQLANRISDFRPEISLYVFLQNDDERALVEELASHAVDGYFYRDEADFNGWFRILVAELADKSATPFYDKLKQYVRMAKDSWHTPGHSGGDSLKGSPWVGDFHDFAGEHLLRADLSVSVPMLDSLLHPTGVIAEAQMLAAKAFGARKTYFATNGTSTSNKVIFQTLLAPGDKLLLDRNCHKSVHHGVILSGARPVYLDSSINRQYGIFGPVPKATIFRAIEENPDARVLILTSCTYDGLRYDLKPIIEAAHERGIKVIVDEAWYGFARFHPAFRPTALESGADYVTQSTHKILSAFSQASMIHVNDPRFDEHLFRENFNMHASTSPQYNLIASLDVARKQAVMEGYRLLDRTLKLAQELREKINSTGAFRVLELEDLLPEDVREDGIQLDPTKLTVDFSQSGFTADELQQALFERYNIQVEKSTFNTITLLLTIGTTRSKLSRLYDAMLRLAKENRPARALGRMPEIPRFTRLACLPRDAFYEAGERLPLLDDDGRPNPALSGRVCCDQIVPYPPGIPVLVPGQVIDDTILAYLARLQKTQKTIEMHGLAEDGGEFYLRVLRPDEWAELPSRALFN
ncbi:aminotransferase class I/II-fold pyridoxal phosphate-dependent enzyme [Chromobacterium paludis]|uniref:Aminotransferase class I/II-fold pyridoxal phosphate-dependent enzyme n=1 Tax=Chromobacterium paludis TaxID=2605945 RepID=A0A5C1DEE0_9NEIS|nr:aminotransferase class I/II-fold pyridoxal phosphate-dependent enzyme [Chromobacterium paludis]QEL54986.1 aminotransferase class I/II-fold pyridoxal phosphate-dependent enzyme [Chromobacterium paludis]